MDQLLDLNSLDDYTNDYYKSPLIAPPTSTVNKAGGSVFDRANAASMMNP